MKQKFKFLRSILIAIFFALFFWTITIMIFEEQFIFFPTQYPDGFYDSISGNLPVEDCWFETEDGLKLHAWYVKANRANGVLLISHGNAGNLSHRLDLMSRLHRHGFSVFMYDYRGYGRSEGSPSEEGVYLDGRAAYDHLTRVEGVDPSRIILFGSSLGGAVAVDLATQREAAGLILEATFSSGKELAQTLYPFLPVKLLMKSEYDSIGKIREIRIPLLVIHGSRDSIVPIELARDLYDAANEPKRFYVIENADHNDTYFVGGEVYFNELKLFAQQVLEKKP